MKIKNTSQNTFGKNFCGPTCISMVLSHFKIKKNPNQVFSLIKKIRNKYKINLEEKRTGFSYFEEHFSIFKKLGLKTKKIFNPSLEGIKSSLSTGKPIIMLVKSFRKNQANHFVVLTNYDTGKIHFNDPQSIYRKPLTYPQFRKKIITKYGVCGYVVTK